MTKLDFDYEAIVRSAKDVIIVTKSYPVDSPGPEIVYVNEAFTALTGYTFEEAIGQSPRILQSKDNNDDEVKAKIRNALKKQIPVSATIKNYSKSGREYWLDMNIIPLLGKDGKVSHFAAIERDVTAQKIIEEQLEILAKTDPLTNLLNRRAFDERLIDEHSRYSRTGDVYSILILDVDLFKFVNDTFGHAVGDSVLKQIANTCLSILRMHDTVSRIGGDEFCIILPHSELNASSAVADKIRTSISKISIEGMNQHVSVSIGVAQVNESDHSYIDTLKRADDSLFRVKKSGRNSVSSLVLTKPSS